MIQEMIVLEAEVGVDLEVPIIIRPSQGQDQEDEKYRSIGIHQLHDVCTIMRKTNIPRVTSL